MLKDGIRKICNSLGRNNDPVIAVLFIAVFKGIFRPAFTMMDKHEKPERKKYAAFREGLTEGIAFCSYLATSLVAHAIAKPLCQDKTKLHKVEKSLSFIAVCLSASAIIPYVCNKTLKPIMDGVQKYKKSKEQIQPEAPAKLDIKENVTENVLPEITAKPTMTYSTSNNPVKLLESVNKPMPLKIASGMKVGG